MSFGPEGACTCPENRTWSGGVCLPGCTGFEITIDGNAPLTCADGEIMLTAT